MAVPKTCLDQAITHNPIQVHRVRGEASYAARSISSGVTVMEGLPFSNFKTKVEICFFARTRLPLSLITAF